MSAMLGDTNPLFPPPRPSRRDITAGLAVALVLIPQSLAYAEIAGLPPLQGLFAAALPPLAASLVASSPYLQTGPSAMTALLTFGSLSTFAASGGDIVKLAALLALVVGAVRLLIGLARWGVVSYLLSLPVLRGFKSAAAILIIASQVPTVLGVAPSEGGSLFHAGWSIIHPAAWDAVSAVLAVLTLALVLGAKRLSPTFPGVLVAVVAGTAFGMLVGDGTITTVGTLPDAGLSFSLDMPWGQIGDLIVPGIVIALVGFAEVAAISMTFAAEDRHVWNSNREFVGQGLANLAAGISGGFPVGGSLSRSSLNRLSGAATRWSGAVAGIAVLAFLPAARLLEPFPRPVLGGIVIAAVVPLVRPDELVRIARESPAQGIVGIATFILTLALAPRVDQAVLIGIAASIWLHLLREANLHVGTDYSDGTLHVRPSGVLYFGSAHRLERILLARIADDPATHTIVIHLDAVGRLDYTSAAALRSMADQLQEEGFTVTLDGITPPNRRIVNRVWNSRGPAAGDDH